MLRQAKINMMVIIGMMVAMGTVAFTAPEKKFAQDYYFPVDSSGEIGSLLGHSEGDLGEDCLDGENENCAIRLDEADVNTATQEANIDNVSEVGDLTASFQLFKRE